MKHALMGFTAAAALMVAGAAQAATIDWTQWGAFTPGGINGGGSATGVSGALGVTYSGELQNLFLNYPSWGPAGTFDGGTVDNAPPSAGGIIQLFGGGQATNTVTFSSAVTNPVFAIWSLGQGGNIPTFNFNAPFTIQSGGPSNEYGGSTIYTVSGDVAGQEGNGTIQFMGTYTSISWTNPISENWYGFTVGTSAVPEPATWAMMIIGFGAVGSAVRRRRRSLAFA